MGLHGALACFGGDFVKKLNPVHPVTPLKGLNEMVSSSAHLTEKPLPKTSSPDHTISRPFTSTKNIVGEEMFQILYLFSLVKTLWREKKNIV